MSEVVLTVTTEDRLDVFLANSLPDHSRGSLQKDIESGSVQVNGIVARKSKKPVRPGDIVILNDQARPDRPAAEYRDLDIIYHDQSIVVVNKPAGMIVHPNRPEETGTLIQVLLGHFPDIAEAIYDTESPVSRLRPGIAHRLDKDTSGVMVVARTADALKNLSNQFHAHTTEKQYLTLVEGRVSEAETIHTMMKRTDRKDKSQMGVSEEGRDAVTHITPEQYYLQPNSREATLLRCVIETGRTHQIRVHCKHIGHPVLGDNLYYNKTSRDSSKRLGIQRQLLHAAQLTFSHPGTGERVTFKAPLPEDFNHTLTSLNPL